jgi:putative membrane protein
MPFLHIVGIPGGAGPFDWSAWIHPDVLIIILALLGAYICALRYLRPRISDAGRVKRAQVGLFLLGLFALYLADSSPLERLSEGWLASAHMMQHVAFTTIAAPLLLAGVPSWLWQWLLPQGPVRGLARWLVHPIVALFVFNGVLLFTHLPPSIELQVQQGWYHILVHALLLLAGLVLWWPVLSNMPELPPISYPMQMAYLFAQSLIPSVLASFLTFSDRLIYPIYGESPRIWERLDPITDQQVGGLVMKLVPAIIMWAFIAVAFFRWYAQHEAQERGPRWEEVEAELQRLGLTRRSDKGPSPSR